MEYAQAPSSQIVWDLREPQSWYEDHYPRGSSYAYPDGQTADANRRAAWEMYMAGTYQTSGETAKRGTNIWRDTGGGWVNGRGDDSMVMFQGYAHIVDFFMSFEWWKTEPRDDLVSPGAFCLAERGKLYAVYLPTGGKVTVKFWASFRTFRDLAIVGLMLLDGLRSCEILAIQLEDLKLADALLHVLGKGKKQRTLPLPGEILDVLQSYLRLERPLTNSPYLFVSLKGRRRGQPITPAGLRSLFRHHRLRSEVLAANPHRFRHTFGADMVRMGISLPALQHLMGHSQIHTTMLYVQLAPQDVWREYARAVANRACLTSPRTPQPFTVVKYQYVARRFVGYLRATFPETARDALIRNAKRETGTTIGCGMGWSHNSPFHQKNVEEFLFPVFGPRI